MNTSHSKFVHNQDNITQETAKKAITKKQLFAKTRDHFGLKKPFTPLVHIVIGYTGHWEIYNLQSEALGVTGEQRLFMLGLIEQHGGLVGGAK